MRFLYIRKDKSTKIANKLSWYFFLNLVTLQLLIFNTIYKIFNKLILK